MASIDVDKYLEPVSDDAPCGENLEYDAAFIELEHLAQGKPEQQSGDSIVPAEEPKWRDVFDGAEALMERTRDLRVVILLMHSGLNLDGLSVLSSGLRLIHGLLQNSWDTVHPELDPDDDNDPTLRVNSLAALNDINGFVRSLWRVPLVESRAAGRFNLRDVRLSNGELAPGDDEERPDGALIDAAFMDCDLDELTVTADHIKESMAALDMIDGLMRDRVGSELAPDFGVLKSDIGAIQGILTEQLSRRGVGSVEPAGENASGDGKPAAQGGLGAINSREDAVRVLDKLSEYFRKHEPSSPVPLLLQRAKRLVAKDFMEILKDLTPDGVSQAELIGGLERED